MLLVLPCSVTRLAATAMALLPAAPMSPVPEGTASVSALAVMVRPATLPLLKLPPYSVTGLLPAPWSKLTALPMVKAPLLLVRPMTMLLAPDQRR